MTCNVGSGKAVTISLAIEMDAFDALPAHLRARLAGATDKWGATGFRDVIEKHGEGMALHVLNKVEADGRAAYERKIGLCLVR